MSLLFVPLGRVCTGLYHILRHLVRGIRDVKITVTTCCNLMAQHSVLACLHSYSQYSSKLLIRYIGLSKIMHKYKYRFCIWQYIWRLCLSQTTLASKRATTTKYSTHYRIASHIGTRPYLTFGFTKRSDIRWGITTYCLKPRQLTAHNETTPSPAQLGNDWMAIR